MPTVVLDARDAHVPMPHGSGVHVRCLEAALAERQGAGPDIRPVTAGGRGPELYWEQVSFPRILRRERADLVHTPNCFLPLRRPCPGVVTIHDLACEAHPEDFSRTTGWKFRTFTRRAARSAECVICVSQFTAQDVCRRYGIDEAKVRVIPNAPALTLGDAPPPPGPYLLAVGDLRPKKNLGVLVAAWRALRAEGLPHRLVLAGADIGEGAALRAAAGTEPLELPGFVSDAELDALLRGADAFVHPSLYEGFGLNVVEAMARGVPAILARATALPETGGDAAEYFEPHDATELARVLRTVLDDAAVRAGMVERGTRRAAALSWAASAEATVAVYQELL